MITLMAIIMFVLFLKIVGLIFGAGLRLLGWLFSGLGFIISILLAVSVIGFVFDMMIEAENDQYEYPYKAEQQDIDKFLA